MNFDEWLKTRTSDDMVYMSMETAFLAGRESMRAEAAKVADNMAGFNGIVIKDAIKEIPL